MKPLETWRKNKWRSDLRKFTREFEKKFKVKKNSLTESGKIYALTYRVSSSFPTDKHHFTPLILSFGRFRGDDDQVYVRGLNLLFLKTHQVLEILEDASSTSGKPDEVATTMIKLHEKYIRIYPYLFKNFEERRILSSEEVSREDWGMIPLLQKNLWGTFNASALDKDFQLESKTGYKKKNFRVTKKEAPKEETVDTELLDEFDSEGNIVIDFD